jgi:hypothetical protein
VSSTPQKVAEREAAYKVYWASDARHAKTSAWIRRWHVEFSGRWVQAKDGSGLVPAPGQPKPVRERLGQSRTLEAHEARVKILRAHPEL